MNIERQSSDPSRPFLNLLPIVDRLVESGNETLDGGFILDPDGWRCRLAEPIDFELIRKQFGLPPNVALGEDHDSVHDRLSWCVIEGPGAR